MDIFKFNTSHFKGTENQETFEISVPDTVDMFSAVITKNVITVFGMVTITPTTAKIGTVYAIKASEGLTVPDYANFLSTIDNGSSVYHIFFAFN